MRHNGAKLIISRHFQLSLGEIKIIYLYIKEKIQRIDHVLTEEEAKRQKKWKNFKPRCWDYIPTGKLILKIDVWEDSGARKKWSDTQLKSVEEQLRDFFEKAFVIADIVRKNKIKQEEERVKQEKTLEYQRKW